MKIIYVTSESPLINEGPLLASMIGAGASRVHIRHPHTDISDIRQILESIPLDMRPRISLHDFHSLASDFGCGIHLNGRNPYAPPGFIGTVSRSCHSLEEIEFQQADYYFLSPIFDSISKTGYKAKHFDHNRLKELLEHRNITALGGIEPQKFEILRSMGFDSVALSGYLTGEGEPEKIIKRLKQCFNS